MIGKVFLVGTPIGNLGDITIRALETLKNCDVIAAEDTRQSLKLLNHFNIKKPLISYHKFNEKEKSIEIIKLVNEGKSVAIVTDAGMPGISDPGSVVVLKCIEENIDFEVIPGPTAFVTALVYSGMDSSKFLFRGFLPRENKDRNEVIKQIKDSRESIMFYEAPHRLKNTLEFLLNSLGDRKIAICRELTKVHEDIKRTSLSEAVNFYKENNAKGEYVLIIEGRSEEEIKGEERAKWEQISVEDHIIHYLEKGFSKKEAIKMTAKDRNVPKTEIYKYSINLK
ncbi:16S rRNA (cytidine(1402)-2'-O)-methyltransferase [Clostridium guangxiense]|uniref:16S rRNA (cytidine(1402)-2'-O)-methyltransferase n=1 Tax=Clostridium guangxiense TaxID=1662055 RepID=UPI001E29A8AC|nr:16S rRNA (cytidine(1402)-2'-O)-methyltransferase [Clostridium guangxiense]MCD2348384.1 16S rRNA (cytidine(1402)-2'-O)-methyltransferase [Clostridium guangxiense]